MIRAIKWIGGLLLLVIILFAGLILLLPKLLDPNDYKDKISDLIYDNSGYRIEIPGDIELHVSPRLDILFSLGQIRVLSGPDFKDITLFSSEEARVELSLLPLLQEKRLVIQGVQLHGGYAHLIRSRTGKGNWELSSGTAVSGASSPAAKKPSAPASTPAPAPTPKTPSTGKQKTLPTLDLGGIELSRITVRYEDQQTDKRFELKNFHLQTGRIQDGKPFHLKSGFTALTSSGSNNNALSVVNEVETDLTFALDARTIRLDNLSLVSLIKAFGLQETEVKLATNAFVDLAKKNVKLDAFKLNSRDLAVQLNAEIANYADPVFSGSFQIPEFSLRKFLQENKLSQPAWKDESALTQFGFSCEFKGNKNTITMPDIQVLLDGTHAKGSLVLKDLKHPAYNFQMHLDSFDLDRYATAPRQKEAAVAKSNGAAQKKAKIEGKASKAAPVSKGSVTPKAATKALEPIFPVDLLRGLRFNVDLSVDSMKMRGAKLSAVTIKANGKDGLLALKPLSAKLYDGSISTETILDVRGELPKLTIKQNLDRVQVGPLLKDIKGQDEVTGAAVMSLQVTSSGNSKQRLIRHANGKMNLALEDGVIKKLHILQVIRQAKALYDGEKLITNAVDEPTGFARLSASGVIKQGVFHNNDLKAASDLMNVTGSGKVDFADEYVDYLLKISLTRGMDRDQKSGRTDYSKFVVPYRIHGKFSEIKEEADVVGILKSQAKSLLMKEVQKRLNKGQGDTKQDEDKDLGTQLLEQGLKSLFGD